MGHQSSLPTQTALERAKSASDNRVNYSMGACAGLVKRRDTRRLIMEEGELGVPRVAFEWVWRRDYVLRVYFFGTYQDLAQCHYHHRPTWTCQGLCAKFNLASSRPVGHQVGHFADHFVGQKVDDYVPTHTPRPQTAVQEGSHHPPADPPRPKHVHITATHYPHT